MAQSRLSLALAEAGLLADHLSAEDRVAVFGPTPETDLSALPPARLQIVSRDAVVHDAFAGLDCRTGAEGPLMAAVVVVPRAKAEARALVAEAVAACPGGLILVDGQKTDGVEPLFKACRARVEVSSHVTKAHGRAFWFRAAPMFDDWQAQPGMVDGFRTLPGVFSADGIDPGSALLARNLPAKPGRHVADLGAGWGFLSARALAAARIEEMHLVESNAAALDCARVNVTDPRARFHWADATQWEPPVLFDTVLMNPPFHQGRRGAPDLGIAFIAAAARVLRPGGQLVLVANRHLPYEAALQARFGKVDETAGDGGFKILTAQRPKRGRR
ncbi:MAG: class I SAM-dependent methyltransferase [Rhodobacteraceae bacterium]|nr:MAG: class I SAM-dependent methyltransferase [Paracoccaceae bacterium]